MLSVALAMCALYDVSTRYVLHAQRQKELRNNVRRQKMKVKPLGQLLNVLSRGFKD